MRWLVPLSSTMALGLVAPCLGDTPGNSIPVQTVAGQTVRQTGPIRQPSPIIHVAPVPPSFDHIPGRVAMLTPVEVPVAPVEVPATPTPVDVAATPYTVVESEEAVMAPPTPAPVRQSTTRYAPVQPQQQAPFGRLMELERRKNAWLRRTFFR